MNAIQEIMRFQFDRKLHEKPYNPVNEHINIVEELLEAIGFDVPKDNRDFLIRDWASFITMAEERNIIIREDAQNENYEVDAYADVIVFACGAIMKLGYDPEKVLTEVSKEINSRPGRMVGGKFEKYTDTRAKSLWYTANFKYCSLEGQVRLEKRREAYRLVHDCVADDETVERWVKTLI